VTTIAAAGIVAEAPGGQPPIAQQNTLRVGRGADTIDATVFGRNFGKDVDVGSAKVKRLTEELGGQSQVASALRVDRAQVTRWLKGARPAPANEAQIDALEFVVARLRRHLPPDTAVKWLTGVNAHLGNRRPLDLLADDRVAEVVAAIEQERAESYA